jgi:hypothetical protein
MSFKIPPGYYVDYLSGVPQLLPMAGPRYQGAKRVQPRTPQPPAQPAQRRQPTVEELIRDAAQSTPLTADAIKDILRTIRDPEVWLPPQIVKEWRELGFFKTGK